MVYRRGYGKTSKGCIALLGGWMAVSCGPAPRTLVLSHGTCPNASPHGEAFRFSGSAFPELDPPPVSDDEHTVVYGYVRSASDSLPLEDVQVYRRPPGQGGVLTDANGRYYLQISRTVADTIQYDVVGFHSEVLATHGGGTLRMDAELKEICFFMQ